MSRLVPRTHGRTPAALGSLAHGLFATVLAAPASESSTPLPPPPFAAHYTLAWEAPPACPDASSIAAKVGALLDPDAQGEGVVAVRGQVRATSEGFHLALETEFRGRVDRRELTASQCDALAEATSLVIAGAMQPAATATATTPSDASTDEAAHAPGPATTPVSATATASTVTPATADRLPRRPGTQRPIALVRAAAMLEAGALPGLSGGPHVAIGIAWPRWRLELHGAYLAPRRLTLGDGGARLMAGVVGLRGCRAVRVRAFELPLCAGVEAGVVRAVTIGPIERRLRNEPQVGPLVSAGFARRWGRVGLWVAAEAVGRALGAAFTFAGTERFRQAPVSARLLAGIEIFGP
ncbi:MAG: hypothetical protein KBB21_36575 [Nannocystaceae bacterium]|nr:hypothetical protein [Nannocystaceae bacterium]